jgi:hypothetical protein
VLRVVATGRKADAAYRSATRGMLDSPRLSPTLGAAGLPLPEHFIVWAVLNKTCSMLQSRGVNDPVGRGQRRLAAAGLVRGARGMGSTGAIDEFGWNERGARSRREVSPVRSESRSVWRSGIGTQPGPFTRYCARRRCQWVVTGTASRRDTRRLHEGRLRRQVWRRSRR